MLASADPVAAPQPPMLPRPFRVTHRQRELPDTVTLSLEPTDGEPFTFEPGQFSMIYAFGVGEVPISFSGARPGGGALHTVRAVGAVSRALCNVPKGGMVGVRGPFGHGWGLDSAEGADLVIVGGGIGLAPLRPVVEAVLQDRQRYGRVAVLVGARTPEALLFTRDLHAWRSRYDLQVDVTVDAAGPDWRGEVGLVTDLVPRAAFDPADTIAMVCGPEVMMRFVAAALLDRGVPADSIRLSLERNMKCAIGQCGHCQLGPVFVCLDGPVLPLSQAAPLMGIREL